MTELLARRLAALIGIVLATTIALWWLGSTRLDLDKGSDAGRSASAALYASWLVRAIVLAMLASRAGVWRSARAGIAEAAAMTAPSWPLVALAWSASALPWPRPLLAELALLACGVAATLAGVALRRALRRPDLAEALATAAGIALAAAIWSTRGSWAPIAG